MYQHFDGDGKLLYIRKAKNLEVSRATSPRATTTESDVAGPKIRDIQWIVTASEADALLLENNMIKEHKPLYNIQLKDDKTYPFIVAKKAFPRSFPPARCGATAASTSGRTPT